MRSGREVQLVLVHLVSAVLVDVIRDLREARDGRVARDVLVRSGSLNTYLLKSSWMPCPYSVRACPARPAAGAASAARRVRPRPGLRARASFEVFRRLEVGHLQVRVEGLRIRKRSNPELCSDEKASFAAVARERELIHAADASS